ncbi:MAG TPA: diguanylate cyclase [Alphaproteobacteria bacterium]|jgi:diguanylate cyclase (GGDEF)-like protein/PAS domain S-box-containing protein
MLREEEAKESPKGDRDGGTIGKLLRRRMRDMVAGTSQPAVPHLALHGAQAASLHKNGPISLLANLVNGLILACVLWAAGIQREAVLSWYTLLMLVVTLTYLFWRGYDRAVERHQIRGWLKRFAAGKAAAGIVWALTIVYLYRGVDTTSLVVIVFLLAGMTAAAVASSAAYRPAVVGFIAPILGGLAFYFFSRASFTDWALGFFALVYFVFINRITQNLEQNLIQEVALKDKNRSLVESLEYAVAETRDREEKFRVIADYSHSWESWFSGDGKLLWVNPGVERMTGYNAEECMNQRSHPMEIVHPEDRETVARAMAAAGKQPSMTELEFRVVCKDGSVRWCAAVSQPAVDTHGRNVGFRASIRDISDRKALQQQLELLASTDPLTGVVNRRRFFHTAEAELYRARRYDRPLVLALVDIDHFKRINDTHGHAVGDDTLKTLAHAFANRLRRSDLFARFGGEEFVLLLPETQLGDGLRLCERLRQMVETIKLQIPGKSEPFGFTVSIGVADLQHEGDSLNQLLARADAALYKAKRDGRNQVAYGAPVQAFEGTTVQQPGDRRAARPSNPQQSEAVAEKLELAEAAANGAAARAPLAIKPAGPAPGEAPELPLRFASPGNR